MAGAGGPSPAKQPGPGPGPGVLGRLGGLFSFRGSSGKPPAAGTSSKKYKVAQLPEGNTFYYDPDTKQWRERGKEAESTAGQAPSSPPKSFSGSIPPSRNMSSMSLEEDGAEGAPMQARSMSGPIGFSPPDSGTASPANIYSNKGSTKDLRNRYVDVAGGAKQKARTGSFGSLNELVTPSGSSTAPSPKVAMFMPVAATASAPNGNPAAVPSMFMPAPAAKRSLDYEDQQGEGAGEAAADETSEASSQQPAMFVPSVPAASESEETSKATGPAPPTMFMPQPAEEEDSNRPPAEGADQVEPAAAAPAGPSMFMPLMPGAQSSSAEAPAEDTTAASGPAMFIPSVPATAEKDAEPEGLQDEVDREATEPMAPADPLDNLFSAVAHGHSKSGSDFFAGLPSPQPQSIGSSVNGDFEGPPGLGPSNLGAAGPSDTPEDAPQQLQGGQEEPQQAFDDQQYAEAADGSCVEQQVGQQQYAHVPYLDTEGNWQYYYGHVNSEEYLYYYQLYCEYYSAYSQEGQEGYQYTEGQGVATQEQQYQGSQEGWAHVYDSSQMDVSAISDQQQSFEAPAAPAVPQAEKGRAGAAAQDGEGAPESPGVMEATLRPEDFDALAAADGEGAAEAKNFDDKPKRVSSLETWAADGPAQQQQLQQNEEEAVEKATSLESWALHGLNGPQPLDAPAAPHSEGSGVNLQPPQGNGTNGLEAKPEADGEATTAVATEPDQTPKARRERRQRKQREKKPKAKLAKALPWEEAAIATPLDSSSLALGSMTGLEVEELLPLQQEDRELLPLQQEDEELLPRQQEDEAEVDSNELEAVSSPTGRAESTADEDLPLVDSDFPLIQGAESSHPAAADLDASHGLIRQLGSPAEQQHSSSLVESLPPLDQVGNAQLTVKKKVMEVQLTDVTALAASDPEGSYELTTNFESDAHLSEADATGHDLPPVELPEEEGMAVLGSKVEPQPADSSILAAADSEITHSFMEHIEGEPQPLPSEAEAEAPLGIVADRPGSEWAALGQQMELQQQQQEQEQQPAASGFDHVVSDDLTAHFEAAAEGHKGPVRLSEELPPSEALSLVGTQMTTQSADVTDLVVSDPETTFEMISQFETEAQRAEAAAEDGEESVLPSAELHGSDLSVVGTQLGVQEADESNLAAADPEASHGYVTHFESEAQLAEDPKAVHELLTPELIGEDNLAVVGQQMKVQPGDATVTSGEGWEDVEDLVLQDQAHRAFLSPLPNDDAKADRGQADENAAESQLLQELRIQIEDLQQRAEEKEGRLLALVDRPCKTGLTVDPHTGLASLDLAICSPTTQLAEETLVLREELERRTEEVQRLLDLEGGQNALLQEQLAKRTGEVQMLVRLEEENGVLKQTLDQKRQDLDSAEVALEALREASRALHDDLEASRVHSSQLEVEIDRISAALETVQAQAASAAQTAAYTERLVAAAAELEAAEKHAAELEVSLTASTREGLELRDQQIAELTVEVEHLREKLRLSEESREATAASASGAAADIEAKEAEAQALRAELAAAQESCAAARAQAGELEARATEFEQQCLAAHLDVDQLRADEEQLKATLAHQQQQLESMEAVLAAQTSKCEELGQLVASAADREAGLAESAHTLSTELIAAQAQLSETLETRDALTSSLREAQGATDILQADLLAAQEREQKLAAEVASVSGELEGARAEAAAAGREALQAAHEEAEEIRSKMRKAIKKGKAIDLERKELGERLAEAAARAQEAEERCAKAEGAVAATREQYEGAFSSLQEELDVARAEAQGLRESLGQALTEQTAAREAAESKMKAAIKKGKAIEKEKKALGAKLAEAPAQEQVAQAMAHMQEDLDLARAEAQGLKESLREALISESEAREALSKLEDAAMGILGVVEAATVHASELDTISASSGAAGQEMCALAFEAVEMALRTKESAAHAEAQLQELASQPPPVPVADTSELDALKEQMAALQARAEAAEARCSKLEDETQELQETTQVQEKEFNDLLACLGQETAKVEALQEVLEGQGVDVDDILGKVEAEYGFGEGDEDQEDDA